MKKPYEVIKIDKLTRKIELPTILLKTKDFRTIGKLNYDNWCMSLVANGLDEVSFDVHKFVNGHECQIWDEITDLKVVDVIGFGQFEVKVTYSDKEETIKTLVCKSLETELGQRYLRDFHVNDDEAFSGEQTEYNSDDYDENGNLIPTVFYSPDDKKHSLLHRVLSDKAPHWSIGQVPNIITVNGIECDVRSFQRTYTVDGTTIYDFLTGEVAEESNVVFIFDTYNRKINVYCMDDIGDDTKILVSKRKLASEIGIETDTDGIKNCFKVSGGDDVITDYIGAVNMTGNSYIYKFSKEMYHDMPEDLVKAIEDYNALYNEKKEEYQDIFLQLCEAYDRLSYLTDEMMPNVSLEDTNAKAQAIKVKSELESNGVAVSKLSYYNSNSFVGVTNNVEAYAQILVDSRYKIDVVKDSVSNTPYYSNHTWSGEITVTRVTDETDTYTIKLSVYINDDELNFVKQKIEKALANVDMLTNDTGTTGMTKSEMNDYFNKFCLSRLKSFYDGYETCLSVLTNNQSTFNNSVVHKSMYESYFEKRNIVKSIYDKRKEEVNAQNSKIDSIEREKNELQSQVNFKDYLDNIDESLWGKLHSYIREDNYQNDNYISDGLTDAEILNKCKELLECADEELSKACVPQRKVTASLNNIFALDEFEQLYDEFALFNYIRVRTNDEILKLRLIQVDFAGDSIDQITVTFSDKVESCNGKISDIKSILDQAQSIATSFSSTSHQAKNGDSAKSEVGNWIKNGLDASKVLVSNSNDNEVTMGTYGILLRNMSDEGLYGDCQVKLIGDGIYTTWDGWETCNLSIGKILIDNEWRSGIIADNVIGNLIAGQTLKITNTSGSFVVNGDKAVFTDIDLIVKDDKHKIQIGNIDADSIFEISSYNDNTTTWDKQLYFDSGTNKLVLTGTLKAGDIIGSTITGGSINIGNGTFKVDKNGNMIANSGTFGGDLNGANGTFSGTLTGADGIFSGTLQSGNIISSSITGSSINGGSITGSNVNANLFRLKITPGSFEDKSDFTYINGDYYIDTLKFNFKKITIPEIKFLGIQEQTFISRLVTLGDMTITIGQGVDKGYLTTGSVQANRYYCKNGEALNLKDLAMEKSSAGNFITGEYGRNEEDVNYVEDPSNIAAVRWVMENFMRELEESTKGGNAVTNLSYNSGTLRYAKGQTFQVASSSDVRLKYDISSINDITDFYMSLKPKSYKFKTSDTNNKIHTGLIAQEVISNLKSNNLDYNDYSIIEEYKPRDFSDEGFFSNGENLYRINYENLHAYHISMIQKHQHEIELLKEKIDELEEKIQ